jgi:hypothetical protein
LRFRSQGAGLSLLFRSLLVPLPPPRLVLFAKGWTFAHHPRRARTWSLNRRLRETAAAGFDGYHASGARGLDAARVQAHGLRFWGQCDIAARRDIRPALQAMRDADAETVLVQLGDHDQPAHVALDLARRVMAEADRLGLAITIETHRDTCTETPEKIYELADAFARAEGRPLPLTWDFSHFILVKHLAPPFARCLTERPDLVQSARSFHLRPCNGHHAQVPVRDPGGRLTPEFRDWLRFVTALFELWLAGPRPGGELLACPELGGRNTNGYCLGTFPDPWRETRDCARHLKRLWRQAGGR